MPRPKSTRVSIDLISETQWKSFDRSAREGVR